MRTRNLSKIGVVVVGLLCAAVLPAAAQQATSSAPAAAQLAANPAPVSQPVATDASTATASPTLSGPRVPAPTFQDVGPIAPHGSASASSPAATTGQHTIVVSTLAIVLAAVIVVLLLVR